MIKIVFPDFPTKVQVTQGRRPVYYILSDKIPKKYKTDRYTFKSGKLYDKEKKRFVIKNAKYVNEPRYQPLSYNKIGARQRITVLVKLKEYMKPLLPEGLVIPTPCMIDCTVYDHPIPLEKDLDNMSIYYKAFQDLLKDMGYIKDDSKQYITQSGGFRYTPVANKAERKMIFSIKEDLRTSVREHLMFNMEPKEVVRNGKHGFMLTSTTSEVAPGYLLADVFNKTLIGNFGKTKVIKAHADKVFNQLFKYCVNYNTGLWVEEEFYRVHSDRIQKFLLQRGIPVNINVK